MENQPHTAGANSGTDAAILAFVRGLARVAAREDHEKAMFAGAEDNEKGRSLRKILNRPSE